MDLNGFKVTCLDVFCANAGLFCKQRGEGSEWPMEEQGEERRRGLLRVLSDQI